MTAPTKISFVRHGHVHNPERIMYGRLPGFGLSESGREQARAAAVTLQDRPLAALFSSPQLRARQTAEIILAPHDGLTLSISPWLNEIHTPYEGWPVEELAARDWDIYSGIEPHYEQPPDILDRVQQFVAEVRQQYAGQQTLAVTHGDNILFMLFWARGLPVATGENKKLLSQLGLPDLYPVPASITTFVYQTTTPDEIPTFEYVKPYA